MAETIKKLTCLACSHEWFPKTPKLPLCCPVCKRADWQTLNGPRSIAAAKNRLSHRAKKEKVS